MYKNVWYPSERKLYEVLKRGKPEYTTPEMLKELEEISRACKICTVYGKGL